MGTLIVGVIVFGIAALIVRSMIRDKKKRKVHSVRRRLRALRRTLPLGSVRISVHVGDATTAVMERE